MRLVRFATFALLLPATPLSAQNVDLSLATPIGGSWTYAQTASGSEARFVNASGQPQAILACTRATRTVSIAKPAPAGSTSLSVWASATVRNLPAMFDAATGRAIATLPAFDPLLDAIVSSRGRFALTVGTMPPLVVPPWAEPARVIEDCRV